MSTGRNPIQKSGNNVLVFIAGFLLVVLMGLIYIGSLQESSVNQLIEAAAPDSSAYTADPGLSMPVAEEVVEEVPEKKPEIQPADTQTKKQVEEKRVSTDSVAAKPVTEPIRVSEAGGENIYVYKIKRGDTMYKIAAKFGNKPADVLAMNGLTDMSVQADKEIKLKVKGVHTVAEGEGLNAIAEKFNVPVKSIKVANGLTSDALTNGAQLIIPLK